MKTFTNQAAQGDVLLQKIERLPDGVVRVLPIEGCLIVSSSETGHHHVIEDERVEMYRLPEEIYECFLVVRDGPATLRHLRGFDTHEPIRIAPGTYRVRRQRERAHTPEGWRRAAD